MPDSCFDAISEAVVTFNKFLVGAAGTTGKAMKYFIDNEKVSHAFFRSYENLSDFCIRAATIVSAPIAFAIAAFEALVVVIYFVFDALVKVCMGDTDKAFESIRSSGSFLLMCMTALIAAVISPIVNLVDLIGGGVATIEEQCSDMSMADYPDYPGVM